jgi:hypothetical protein
LNEEREANKRQSVSRIAEYGFEGTLEVSGTAGSDYVIRGGLEGRERLRVLSRIMQPTTRALFERVAVTPNG